MTAAETLELEDTDTDTDDDQEDGPARDEAATARRIAGYLIVGGVAIACVCIGFIVWEQWQANRAALASVYDEGATLEGFPVAGSPRRDPAPDPGPSHQPGGDPGQEGASGSAAGE